MGWTFKFSNVFKNRPLKAEENGQNLPPTPCPISVSKRLLQRLLYVLKKYIPFVLWFFKISHKVIINVVLFETKSLACKSLNKGDPEMPAASLRVQPFHVPCAHSFSKYCPSFSLNACSALAATGPTSSLYLDLEEPVALVSSNAC